MFPDDDEEEEDGEEEEEVLDEEAQLMASMGLPLAFTSSGKRSVSGVTFMKSNLKWWSSSCWVCYFPNPVQKKPRPPL